jgi:hypothetical protein
LEASLCGLPLSLPKLEYEDRLRVSLVRLRRQVVDFLCLRERSLRNTTFEGFFEELL